jgi:hypothetical protein
MIRSITAPFVAIVLAGCAVAEPAPPPPYRQLETSLGLFSCTSGNYFNHVLSSLDETRAHLLGLEEKCFRDPIPTDWKERFVRDLEREGVDFRRESVVLVQQVFGSSMINGRIDFALAGRTIRADVRRIIPEGPLVPDIAVRKFAFAVDRTSVDKVVILLDGKEQETIELR